MSKRIAPGLFIKAVGRAEYYIARTRRGGRYIEKSFGRTDRITRPEAKRLAAAWLLTATGDRPSAALTYSEAWPRALEDIALLKQWRSPKSRVSWERSLREVEPALGGKILRDITTQDVVDALRERWMSHPEASSRCRMRLEAVFAWARTRGFCDSNPAVWRGNIDQYLPPRGKVARVKHHEAPTLPELQKAVAYCLSHPSPVSGAILFGIATVGRVTEWRLAEAGEIEGNTWVMPAERRKDGRDFPHRVPLSSLAKKALKMARKDGLLFTATGKPLSVDSPRLKLVMILGRPVTMHGVRSTFRDWCALHGVPDVLAEKSLSHQWGNEVTEAYLRSDLLEQRRPVLEKWAKAVTERPAS